MLINTQNARGLLFLRLRLLLLLLGLGIGPRANHAQSPLVASSELTLRTTSSVDLQVCASGVLSDERAALETVIAARLRADLRDTSAVYLVRTYAINGGACFLYVYQAASPTDAAETEAWIAAQEANRLGTLTVNLGGVVFECALAVVPWRGEDPPLPLWAVPASTLVEWTLIAGSVLASCLLAACCFVFAGEVRNGQRMRRLLEAEDKRKGAPVKVAAAPKKKTETHPKPSSATTTPTTITTNKNGGGAA